MQSINEIENLIKLISKLPGLGPKPGSLDISLTSSSISLMFCMNYKGHLKPGIPKPPVAFEISSEVFDFNCALALL